MNIIDDVLMPAKRIVVYDVAASASGTLSVLNDFYGEARSYGDKSVEWTFVISTPHLEEAGNIKVIHAPWVKKSWLCRIFFDWFFAPKIVKESRADVVFSLQNIVVPRVKARQIVYLHQSLPFYKRKFSLISAPLLYVRQNVISRLIYASVKKASAVIVQTKWIKAACSEKTGAPEDKIKVIPPKVSIQAKERFACGNMDIPTFIYPATPLVYKNHQAIVAACKELAQEGVANFRVIFTINGEENKLSRKLKEDAERSKLPIEFAGVLKRDELFGWYARAALLFPSYLESFGMPLLEARMHGAPVIAADTPFGREVLEGYESSSFFAADDAAELAGEMRRWIQGWGNASDGACRR